MIPTPPSIDSRGSATVGGHAIVCGCAAAMIGRFIPGNWLQMVISVPPFDTLFGSPSLHFHSAGALRRAQRPR
jgi:hypothetical protein